MLQGIVLSFEHSDQLLLAASRPGALPSCLLLTPPSPPDGSQTHTFLEGHHTGITIPLKYSSSPSASSAEEEDDEDPWPRSALR
jgi:hypothetical protein